MYCIVIELSVHIRHHKYRLWSRVAAPRVACLRFVIALFAFICTENILICHVNLHVLLRLCDINLYVNERF